MKKLKKKIENIKEKINKLFEENKKIYYKYIKNIL